MIGTLPRSFAVFLLALLIPVGVLSQESLRPFASGGMAIGTSATHARIPVHGGFGEESQVTGITGEAGFLAVHWEFFELTPFIKGGGGLKVQRYGPGRLHHDLPTHLGGAVTVSGGVQASFGPTAGFLGSRFLGGQDSGYVGLEGGLAVPPDYH